MLLPSFVFGILSLDFIFSDYKFTNGDISLCMHSLLFSGDTEDLAATWVPNGCTLCSLRKELAAAVCGVRVLRGGTFHIVRRKVGKITYWRDYLIVTQVAVKREEARESAVKQDLGHLAKARKIKKCLYRKKKKKK